MPVLSSITSIRRFTSSSLDIALYADVDFTIISRLMPSFARVTWHCLKNATYIGSSIVLIIPFHDAAICLTSSGRASMTRFSTGFCDCIPSVPLIDAPADGTGELTANAPLSSSLHVFSRLFSRSVTRPASSSTLSFFSIEGLHIFIIVTSSLIRFCVENFNSFDKSDNTLIYRISVPSSIFDESDFNCARLSSDTSIISASFDSSSVVFTSKRFLKYHMKSFTN